MEYLFGGLIIAAVIALLIWLVIKASDHIKKRSKDL
jgi:hypothetical protein